VLQETKEAFEEVGKIQQRHCSQTGHKVAWNGSLDRHFCKACNGYWPVR